jgi:hypothetical protein
MMRQRTLSALSVALLVVMAARASAATYRLADVPRDHWASDYVRRVTSTGLMTDYNGRFLGNSPVNRYQMSQILSRLLDRMGSQALAPREPEGRASNEIFLQIADEVASLNVAHSTLEEKVVQLRHDMDSVKNGSDGHGHHRITPDEWDDRLRTQAPYGLATLLVFASAGFLLNK